MASLSSSATNLKDTLSDTFSSKNTHSGTLLDTYPSSHGQVSGMALLSPPLSPPLSRAPSPLPPHITVNTDPGRTKGIIPLPSPVTSPETRLVGKKTSAFFGSPFDRDTPLSPMSVRPSISNSSTTPPSPVLPEPERPHSANSTFFFVKGSATPTPPPSVHSHSSDDSHGARAPLKLPPLSRFFPSRATIDRDPADLSDDSGNLSGSSPPSIHTSLQRDFVTIDQLPSFASSPTDLNFPDSPPPKLDLPSPPPPPPQQQQRQPQPLHRETLPLDKVEFTQGTIIGTDVPLRLVRELGLGAFSYVWLALDVDHKLEGSRPKCESMARKKGDRPVHGLRPPSATGSSLSRSQSVYLAARDGGGATSTKEHGDHDRHAGNLVAVKMMDRSACDADDRTRISFVREVEVLRHISHPSIVSYLHSFTTPTHHCLVLEALQGGELFELLDQNDNHRRITEPLLRRMFGELCQAVGWMHGVGLVHRDLKLENILLTTNPFLTNPSSPITLASLPSPLIKITDFGLARFIDPAHPTLVTRCGSESYAAPEIVTGKPYDGRQTDAWACGVVLYALATRTLPFDRIGTGDRRDTRRAHLMRIAQGFYTWPEETQGEVQESNAQEGESGRQEGEHARLATEGLKSVVARLLVRNAAKRARIVELWDEPWMRGEGAPMPPLAYRGDSSRDSNGGEAVDVDECPSSGRLVGNEIPSVAKQEL